MPRPISAFILPSTFSGFLIPISFIHVSPKRSGEYHVKPMAMATNVATTMAVGLTEENGMVMREGGITMILSHNFKP
jgi:hypothetical protein